MRVMEMVGLKLGEILQALGVVRQPQIASALDYSSAWGLPFGQACIELSFAEERHVLFALALQSETEVRDLAGITIPAEILARLDAESAIRLTAIPIGMTPAPLGQRNALVVAMAHPTDAAALVELSQRTRAAIHAVVASQEDIENAIVRHYHADPTGELELTPVPSGARP